MNGRTGKFAGLALVTIFALAVILAASGRAKKLFQPVAKLVTSQSETTEDTSQQSVTSTPVTVRHLQPANIEILDSYTGMIRPFRRSTLSFDMPGRVITLGQRTRSLSDSANPDLELDVGDWIEVGQVLATLDQRSHHARLHEAKARLDLAEAEFERGSNLKERDPSAISDSEFHRRSVDVAVTQAQMNLASIVLEDSTLVALRRGVISHRYLNPGEVVNANEPVFEVVEVEQVLLVVGVPESRIRQLDIHRQQPLESEDIEPAEENSHSNLQQRRKLQVRVELLARDRFGNRDSQLHGYVYRIGETADDTTGLFEVEILLQNTDRTLKPGLVARADIIVDHLSGYRVPLSSALQIDGDMYLYSVARQEKSEQNLLDDRDRSSLIAQRWKVNRWIEQGADMIMPDVAPEHQTVVIRGQHRLYHGRPVTLVNDDLEISP